MLYIFIPCLFMWENRKEFRLRLFVTNVNLMKIIRQTSSQQLPINKLQLSKLAIKATSKRNGADVF